MKASPSRCTCRAKIKMTAQHSSRRVRRTPGTEIGTKDFYVCVCGEEGRGGRCLPINSPRNNLCLAAGLLTEQLYLILLRVSIYEIFFINFPRNRLSPLHFLLRRRRRSKALEHSFFAFDLHHLLHFSASFFLFPLTFSLVFLVIS